MNKESENKICCDIEKYICDNGSICREERQYALFLNNILYKYKKPDERSGDIAEVFKACHIPPSAEIINVFYEATFMRDIFERDRKNNPTHSEFNDKLIEYVQENNLVFVGKYIDDGKPYNLGSRKSKHGTAVRSMMNSKPDIAVIYKEIDDGKQYLLFLECKFESEEIDEKKQRVIQWWIADFLCGKCLTDLKVSPQMKNDKKSQLVQFVRKDPQNYNEIPIKTLIELNEDIFNNK